MCKKGATASDEDENVKPDDLTSSSDEGGGLRRKRPLKPMGMKGLSMQEKQRERIR
jgi:hypothetical protein